MCRLLTRFARSLRSNNRATCNERGSALILIPAWILILTLLGGVAVDTAMIHMAQRRGNRQLAMIAADASQILDTGHLLDTGEMQVHPDGARRVIEELLGHTDFPGTVHGQPNVEINAATGTVTIRLELEVEHVFLKASPRMPDFEVVPIQATAVFVP